MWNVGIGWKTWMYSWLKVKVNDTTSNVSQAVALEWSLSLICFFCVFRLYFIRTNKYCCCCCCCYCCCRQVDSAVVHVIKFSLIPLTSWDSQRHASMQSTRRVSAIDATTRLMRASTKMKELAHRGRVLDTLMHSFHLLITCSNHCQASHQYRVQM